MFQLFEFQILSLQLFRITACGVIVLDKFFFHSVLISDEFFHSFPIDAGFLLVDFHNTLQRFVVVIQFCEHGLAVHFQQGVDSLEISDLLMQTVVRIREFLNLLQLRVELSVYPLLILHA